MDNLKEKTAGGLLWGALNSGSMQILNALIGFVLARLLDPADYGIVGMLTIFIAIAGNLRDSGFASALVNLKRITDNDYNAVFWFNLLSSLAIYVLLFFCAPLIADFYHQPALVSLSRVIFLSFVISSFGLSHSAYLNRNMLNKEKALITLVAMIVGGLVGILAAVGGLRYWALAWQSLTYITLVSIGRFYYSAWRPSFRIDFGPIRKMFGFSSKILATTIINTVGNNVLTVILGRLYPARTVGNFSQAYKWDAMGYGFISDMVLQVAQPVIAAIEGEEERQLRVFRKLMRFTAMLGFPALFGLSFVAKEFIFVTLSAKWADSVPLLQMLCISGAFMPFYTIYQNLCIGRGRSDLYMWGTLSLVLAQLLLITGLHTFGVTTMVAAYALLNIFGLLIWQSFAKRLIHLQFRQALTDILPFAGASLAAILMAYGLTFFLSNIYLLLILRIILVGSIYFGILKLFRVRLLEEALDYFRKRCKA